MIYEVINPHMPCTFEAPDLEVATLTMGVLSNNLYGAEPEDPTEDDLPPFPMGGSLDWWKTQFTGSPEARILVRNEAIFAALKSLRTGSFEDRHEAPVHLAVSRDPECQPGELSSLQSDPMTQPTDIVSEAWKIADQFAAVMKE